MRKLAFAAALLLVMQGCTKPDPAAEKAAIEGAVRGFYTAIEKYDIAGLKSFVAPAFTGFEDGKPMNVDFFTSQLEAMPGGSIKFDMEFVRTDPGTDVAHTIVRFDANMEFKGQKIRYLTYENYILKKMNGKWLISAYHSTHLNAPKRLDSGAMLGMHVLDASCLKPGVTMEEARNFWFDVFTPAFNKCREDVKIYPLLGSRGADTDKLGFVYHIESVQVRDALWDDKGQVTPAGQEMLDKLKPQIEEMNKLMEVSKDRYTDWIVK